MYSLADYGTMIADRARLDEYAEALRRLVTPRSIVVDIGAGTGVMSLLACKLGARRVYAIEPSPAVQILAEAARENGCADRVVILQRRSTELTLPERADVIVSDLRGVLPAYATHFADIVDARGRLLAPGGRLVPETDTLWLAVVSAPEEVERRRGPWQEAPHGLALGSMLPFLASAPFKYRARPAELVGPPVAWARVHYPTLTELGLRGSGACTVARAGTAHGLLVWFDAVLTEGVTHSNAPGVPEGIYGQMFFPWPEAVALQEGDSVGFEVRADPVGADYVWTWTTEIRGAARPATRFRQSTFKAALPSPDSLRRRAPTFAPTLSPSGVQALEALEGMRAGRTVGEIAERLFAAAGGRFRSLDDAHGFVAELVERYGV
jgi:precorrin-6B methylase 2